MPACLNTYKDEIQSIAAILGVFALAIAAWQIYAARNALQAGTALATLEQAREIAEKIRAEPGAYDYILRPDIEATPKAARSGKGWIHQMINFYSALHLQQDLGTIPDSLWALFDEEFRSFINRRRVCEMWCQTLRERAYTRDFKEYVLIRLEDGCPGD